MGQFSRTPLTHPFHIQPVNMPLASSCAISTPPPPRSRIHSPLTTTIFAVADQPWRRVLHVNAPMPDSARSVCPVPSVCAVCPKERLPVARCWHVPNHSLTPHPTPGLAVSQCLCGVCPCVVLWCSVVLDVRTCCAVLCAVRVSNGAFAGQSGLRCHV